MTSTNAARSLPVQLAELIELAASAATGPAAGQLAEAHALALQLGERLVAERTETIRTKDQLAQADAKIQELEATRQHMVRNQNATLDTLTRVRAELARRTEERDQALNARDAAADRIAELADEKDRLTRLLDRQRAVAMEAIPVRDAALSDLAGLRAQVTSLREMQVTQQRDYRQVREALTTAEDQRDRARAALRRLAADARDELATG
jgi:chromosome segregation ATPase